MAEASVAAAGEAPREGVGATLCLLFRSSPRQLGLVAERGLQLALSYRSEASKWVRASPTQLNPHQVNSLLQSTPSYVHVYFSNPTNQLVEPVCLLQEFVGLLQEHVVCIKYVGLD